MVRDGRDCLLAVVVSWGQPKTLGCGETRLYQVDASIPISIEGPEWQRAHIR